MNTFFTKVKCDRCGERLQGRFMSKHGTDALCPKCNAEEESAVMGAAADQSLVSDVAKNSSFRQEHR